MKAQSAIEFIETVVIVALVFLIFSVFIANELDFMFNVDYRTDKARQLADLIARNIDYAYVMGDGYQSNFSIPQAIRGVNYTINLNATSRTVEVDIVETVNETDRYGSAHFIPYNVEFYNMARGVNIIVSNSHGNITLRGSTQGVAEIV